MKQAKQLFQYASYLQYPLMLLGLYYVYLPFFNDFQSLFSEYNKALIFMGLAISFSTLQDSQKTQNKLSKRIWENVKYSKIFLTYLIFMTLGVLIFGVYSLVATTYPQLQELSFGIIALGIGMMGLLKSALEMAEYHQSNEFTKDN
jgi:hypothetical protein